MLNRSMERIAELAPTRAHLVAGAVAIALAVVVAFIPLFNLVGYESAALFGAVLGLLSTGLTVHAVKTGSIQSPLSSDRTRRPIADFATLLVVHLAMAAGPLLVLSLNGLRVPNCDWGVGLAFWGLIVGPAILIGQTGGWLATALADELRVLPWVIAFGIPLISAVSLLTHLATNPPIIGHQWFIGYFGGSIYDEALAVPASLIAYRILNVVAVVGIIAAIEAAFDFYRSRRAVWSVVIAVIAAAVVAIGMHYQADFGIGIDGDFVADELGGKVESEHFVIYYPDRTEHTDRLQEMVADHEYRYHQMRQFFGTDPVADRGEKLTSYVYGDRDTKQALMGARNTMVAKLWLHEMHILWGGTGDSMLAHELAHIFTEPFGAGPLRLSTQWGFGVNMGLVEGVAVAAEWPVGELSPHEASAAMRRLDIDPELNSIVGAGGFWSEASGPAYTAMGSFVRYLIDTEGIESFKEAYPTGDFQGGYGVGVDELVAGWQDYVDAIELTDQQQSIAEDRYDRSSIFARECARANAELHRMARSANRAGDPGSADEYYRRLLELDPERTTARREWAKLLLDTGDYSKAMEVVDGQDRDALSDVQRGRFLEVEGDILWSIEKPVEARNAYERALEVGMPTGRQRSLLLKRLLVEKGDERGRTYLVERPSDVEAMHLLMQWRQASPDDPVAAYLVGRLLWSRHLYAEAIDHLEAADGQFDFDVLDAEASLMLGESLREQQRFDDAQAIFEQLSDSQMTRYREQARLWLDRLQWDRRNID